ncbi:hypothetical protein J437_LFUL005502, partial [Ladona fulva]
MEGERRLPQTARGENSILKMKISVRVRGDWLQVPCKDGKINVRWLGEEALKRYQKLRWGGDVGPADEEGKVREEKVQEVRKTRGGVILDPDDLVKEILDDNDFVSVDQENMSHLTSTFYLMETVYPPMTCSTLAEEDIKLRYGYLFTFIFTEEIILPYSYLTKESEESVQKSRNLVEKILQENKVVYGITTGFGNFARTSISAEKLEELQCNLIRSHAAGVGSPLPPERTRMLLALRINVLAKGNSGISLHTLRQLINAFNESCLSWVPEQGSVGASGDLAPLAHLALGLMGEGKMWSPDTGWGDANY